MTVHWTVTMAQTGGARGFPGHRPQRAPGSRFIRIEEGQIADGWNQMDSPRLTGLQAQP